MCGNPVHRLLNAKILIPVLRDQIIFDNVFGVYNKQLRLLIQICFINIVFFNEAHQVVLLAEKVYRMKCSLVRIIY